MNHSNECNEYNERIANTRAEWEREHPGHCKHCKGNGAFSCPGSLVPYGSTNVHLPDEIEPCEHCWGIGKCPWCMQEGIDIENNDICKNCGWKSGKDYAPPDSGDCICQFDNYWD